MRVKTRLGRTHKKFERTGRPPFVGERKSKEKHPVRQALYLPHRVFYRLEKAVCQTLMPGNNPYSLARMVCTKP